MLLERNLGQLWQPGTRGVALHSPCRLIHGDRLTASSR
jgi:hypothetical protein